MFRENSIKTSIVSRVIRSPAQVGCMRQVLRAGALGRPRGMGWGGRWEGGSGWGTHVNLWLIHVNVWQKPLQCCKVISLKLIKINYIYIYIYIYIYTKKNSLYFLFVFCHWGGRNLICISEVIEISPGNLDSSLCFIQPSISYDVFCTVVLEKKLEGPLDCK